MSSSVPINESGLAFQLQGVCHQRKGRQVLDNVTVSLPRSRPTCLVGASGSGKTSFLRLLNRLESPQSGTILYAGQPIESYPVRQLRAQVGFAFQAPAMFEGSVQSNLLTAARFARRRLVDHDHDLDLVRQCLELAELDADYAQRDALQLSGGEKQRVALARTLMTQPDVLLLDEPTSALDPDSGRRLVQTLRRLVDSGMTIVMATHRLEEAQWLRADSLVFDQGRIVETRPATQMETISHAD